MIIRFTARFSRTPLALRLGVRVERVYLRSTYIALRMILDICQELTRQSKRWFVCLDVLDVEEQPVGGRSWTKYIVGDQFASQRGFAHRRTFSIE